MNDEKKESEVDGLKTNMEIKYIPVDNDAGGFTIFKVGNFEYENPREKYYYQIVKKVVDVGWRLVKHKLPYSIMLNKVLHKKGIEEANEILSKIDNRRIPNELKLLLQSRKKKKQQQLLKNITLKSIDIASLAFWAYGNLDYKFSQYRFEHDIAGIENEIIPRVLIVDGDNVEKHGKTTLSDGKLKNVVNGQNVVIANFLDNDEEWHCFFITYKSLKGLERHNGGVPHYHYISDKWGKSRDEVIKQLKSKNYKLPPMPHINFERGNNN